MKKIILLIIFLYAMNLSSSLSRSYKTLDLREPIFGTYRSDEMIFLKTFYLMKSGSNYYDSFQKAAINDYANIKLGPDIFTWRLPTIFYFWAALATNGSQILTIYWILSVLFLISIWVTIGKIKSSNRGLLALLLVLLYFAGNISYKTSFLFPEWWALFFFGFAMAFFVHKKFAVSGMLFFLSVATRELMIIPVISFLVLSICLKRNRIFFATLILSAVVFFAIHAHFVSIRFPITQSNIHTSFISRFHIPDKKSFLTMTSFSFQNYPLAKYRISLIFIIISFLGLQKQFKKRQNIENLYYYLAPWSMLVIFPFITTSFYNDYWGILFMPLLISTLALL